MVSYSQIIGRAAEIRARLPPRYVQGRSWDPIRSRSVLSLGCGSSESEQFRELLSFAASVDGVDSDPMSGARYASLAEVPTGAHDALVAEHVLEHMTHEEVVDALTHAARILRPGSAMIVTLPNISNFGSWFNNFDHKNFSPPEDTAAIIELHGFQVVDMFGWSKQSRFERHARMPEEERRLCSFMEENWGLTLPQFITIGAIRLE